MLCQSDKPLRAKKRLSSSQIIILGFSSVILLGTCFLMLPCSSREKWITPFVDALFTATSAVCVTGLVVQDTATYWSAFGQSILLLLIQIGGMGVITVAACFTIFSGKKISLMQRSTMQEALSAPHVGGIVRLTGFILKATILIELLGAIALAPVFCSDYGWKGLWMALFHSISAFCNAGFDLTGMQGKFSSLTAYADQPVVNLTVMSLIIVGGIGFLTWEDVWINRWHWHKYRMQSKVVLCTTAVLLIFPAIYFYYREFSAFPAGERILLSLFQSVTPRTAGFNTANFAAMNGQSICIMIILMLIGGSPGSTAGGMKTTTVTVLLSASASTFRRRQYVTIFGRRISGDAVKHAATIALMYAVLFLSSALVISLAENLPMHVCLFETASAVGTVGLTLGITPDLGILSKLVLILLMFFGRVGGLTLIFAALSEAKKTGAKLPQEKITIG